jgi:hypothetical protein
MQEIEIQVEGEMSTLKGTVDFASSSGRNLTRQLGTVNFMVDQLSAFVSEMTRVALEVGTQCISGGQVKVSRELLADLTRNVNVRAFPRLLNFSSTDGVISLTENGLEPD